MIKFPTLYTKIYPSFEITIQLMKEIGYVFLESNFIKLVNLLILFSFTTKTSNDKSKVSWFHSGNIASIRRMSFLDISRWLYLLQRVYA